MAGLDPDRRAYRRGLVLGWSLAEVFLLILFALLFAFAALAIKWQTKDLSLPSLLAAKTKLGAELRDAQRKLKALQQENDELRKALRNPDQISDLFHKLSLCEQRIAELENQNNDFAQAQPLLDWMKQEHLMPEGVKNLAETAEKNERDARQCEDQRKYCQAQLAKFGGGADYPPCWMTPDGLKPEYIFNISLTSDGIIVHDDRLPDRVQDEKELPTSAISFDNDASDDAFEQQTYPLFKYSEGKNCRFFVRVFDQTRPDEKQIYKQRLRAVEAHFYKLESNAAADSHLPGANSANR